MKKIFTIVGQQKLEERFFGDSDGVLYPECKKKVKSSLLPTLLRNIEKKETFKILALDSFKTEYSDTNYKLLEEELNDNFPGQFEIERLYAPVKGSGKDQVAIFKAIYQKFEEDDEIYFDITFGMKPTPMAVLVACNFAKKFVKGVRIRKLIYTLYDFTKDENYVHKIIDVTSLFYLDQLIDTMSSMESSNPTAFIESVFQSE
ncbi:MAG: TM1812 family CRISPR-associated protein [Longicatena sp.]